MKKLKLNGMVMVWCLMSMIASAQVPETMSYQAVVRDAEGHLRSNQLIVMKIRILQGDYSGTCVYEEVHEQMTNTMGLLTCEVGNGVVLNGNLSNIDWAASSYFIETSFRTPEDLDYAQISTHRITSVPYALYAKRVENGFTGDYNDLINIPDISDSVRHYLVYEDIIPLIDRFQNLQDSLERDEHSLQATDGALMVYQRNRWDTLTIGSEGTYLSVVNGIPTWKKSIPEITTIAPKIDNMNSISVGGIVRYNTNVHYSSGICWSTHSEPEISDFVLETSKKCDSFNLHIENLLPGTTYYVRAFTSDFFGVHYGEIHSVDLPLPPATCLASPSIVDIDGNVYNTVQIGNQCWMRENLRVKRFADGQEINTVLTPNYAVRQHDCMNDYHLKIYGLMYSWYAVMRDNLPSESNPSGIQGVCPNGWHVPGRGEWESLKNFLNSQSLSESSIAISLCVNKEIWQNLYTSNQIGAPGNIHATGFNNSGFSAYPGGYINQSPGRNGSFCISCSLGYMGYWASSSANDSFSSVVAMLNFASPDLELGAMNRENCVSVRCIRD